jgi:hypothetical protein
MKILEVISSGDSALPLISNGNFNLPRGVSTAGGQSIASYLPNSPTFRVSDSNASVTGLHDFMKGVGCTVASLKLRGVVERFSSEVEYIPIDLLYAEEHHSGYFLMVPLRQIRGVDLALSDVTLGSVGVARRVGRLILDDTKFADVAISTLFETGSLVVSEELGSAIIKSKCTGCEIVDPIAITL